MVNSMIDPLSRRTLLKAGALAVSGLAAGQAAAQPLTTKRHQISLQGLTGPLRLVHVTDVHVGWSTPVPILQRAQRMAHKAKPDLVVLTGDYVNHSLVHLERLKRFVRGLPRPLFATLGNHDHWSGADPIRAALLDSGAEVLDNQHTELRTRAGLLPIVGMDDGRTGHHDLDAAFSGLRHPERAVVLSHCPSIADALGARNAGLILSGHTHGGQIAVPKLTPALVKAWGVPYTAGWFQLSEASRLYVNAGLGHSRRGLRMGRAASPEVAVIDLIPAGAL